ncbi:PIN domain-containing protein [Enterovirga sp. CN4-39]|uniref:PIN domain-containing protein n=1 Tax=Enterovirga sp. CN4-39 TaxID=3400910 RepID=UPI003C012211
MRVALDTNVLAYAEGLDDDRRGQLANDLVEALTVHELVLPVQVSAELTRLVMKRLGGNAEEAAVIVRRWQRVCPIHPPSTPDTFATALDLAAEHRLQIFDCIILAASAKAGCQMLLSEDMQDGFVWRGVTVVNPFAATPHPLLADLLRN